MIAPAMIILCSSMTILVVHWVLPKPETRNPKP